MTENVYEYIQRCMAAEAAACRGAKDPQPGELLRLREEVAVLRAHKCSLPEGVAEALNSGDGSYKP